MQRLSDDKNVLVKFRGKMLINTLCSHTICFVSKLGGGCQGSSIPIKVVHAAQKGEWCCWVSTCIPKVWPIISMYSQHHLHLHSTRFNPRSWEGGPHRAGCCQQPTVTALSAIPLIIAGRSPCVEPNRGVLGVNGAKASEESPLEDNQKTADWLQPTQRGIRAFHMNINVLLTGILGPGERKEKLAEESQQNGD